MLTLKNILAKTPLRTRAVRTILHSIRRGGGRLRTKRCTTRTNGVRIRARGGLRSPDIRCDPFCTSNIAKVTDSRLIIGRKFRFPAHCITHHDSNGLRRRIVSHRRQLLQRSILLQTGGLYLSLVKLGRRHLLLRRHQGGTSRLLMLFRGQLDRNSTDTLRIGGVGVRHVGIRARTTRGTTTRQATLRRLLTVGKGRPLRFSRASCPGIPPITSCGALCSRIVTSSITLRATSTRIHTTRGRIDIGGRG